MRLGKRFIRIKMIVGKICFMASATLLFTLCAASSHAHNLWIVGDVNNNGDGTVHLYFEHHVGPGDGSYNGPIEKRGKTWVRTPQCKSVPIVMKEISVKDTKYLVGNSGGISAPFAIDHTSLYGIYHGRLDFFHGRYIEATDRESLAALAESPHLPAQIVPEWREKGLLLRVMYFSNPRPRAKLTVIEPGGTEREIVADNKGEVLIPTDKPGKYHISVLVFENEAAGAFEYEAFKGIMHGTTLTIKLPIGKDD
jgi:hypothetical protein